MRIAYADPPYPGQARKHYKHDPSGIPAAEVDHAALIAQLQREYDGWALSTSAQALRDILPLCPAGTRVCAWCKPFAAWKSCNPAYTWEPVIVKQPRKSNYPSVRDYLLEPMTTRTGTHGAKPQAFYFWLFECLNMTAGDEFIDLFPGSGGGMRAWAKWHFACAPDGRSRKKQKRPQMVLLEA